MLSKSASKSLNSKNWSFPTQFRLLSIYELRLLTYYRLQISLFWSVIVCSTGWHICPTSLLVVHQWALRRSQSDHGLTFFERQPDAAWSAVFPAAGNSFCVHFILTHRKSSRKHQRCRTPRLEIGRNHRLLDIRFHKTTNLTIFCPKTAFIIDRASALYAQAQTCFYPFAHHDLPSTKPDILKSVPLHGSTDTSF